MTSPFPGERDEERAKRQIPVAQVLGKWWRVVTVAVLFASAQLGLGGTRLVVASPGPDGPRAPAARAASAQGAARDYSRLYSSATLESVRAYYERTSGKIRDQLIAPALFAAEKQSLSGTQYAFPVYLSPVSPAQPHPTNFVAFGNTVVLPLFP